MDAFRLLEKVFSPFTSRVVRERSIIEGYQILRGEDYFQKIRNLKDLIIESELIGIYQTRDIKITENLLLRDFRSYHSQKITSYLLNSPSLVRSLALMKVTKTKLWFPLPKKWRKEFSNYDIPINYTICTLMWFSLNVSLLFRSLYRLNFSILIKPDRRVITSKPQESDDRIGIYLVDAQKDQLPTTLGPDMQQNFANWLGKYRYPKNNLHFFHSVADANNLADNTRKITSSHISSIHDNHKFISRLITAVKVLKIVFMFRRGLHGNRFNLILNSDHIFQVLLEGKSLGTHGITKIIFTISSGIIKPLWAIQAERSGISVVYAFYATASEPKSENGIPYSDALWKLSTWNDFWVTDQEQLEYLSNLIQNASVRFEIIGVPYWSDSGLPIFLKPNIYITLFDTAPQFKHFSDSNIQSIGLTNLDIIRIFFDAILLVASSLEIKVLHKTKRALGKKNLTGYQQILLDLQTEYPNTYIQMDPSIGASRLLPEGIASIATPLSTTAIIARNLSIPSAYFDATGKISVTDPSIREIPVFYDQESLRRWLLSLLS